MTNYVLNEEKMFADVTDGIAIIINSETGIYYGMNGFGTTVYENIVNGASVEDILIAIKALPGVPSDIDANYELFIKAMVDNALIIKGNASSADVKIDVEIAEADHYILEIKEYNDAQELLLADPIHEVKEEEGWSPEKSSLNEDKEDVERREAKVE